MYLDDLLVYSSTAEEHLAHLRKVFERLRRDKLFAKRRKCTFGSTKVKYLGHIVENGTVHVDEDKVGAVQTWPAPSCVKHV